MQNKKCSFFFKALLLSISFINLSHADINKGAYVGIGSGMVNDNGQTYQLTGGYMFNSYYGLEANYVYFNNISINNSNENISAQSVNGLFAFNQRLGSSPINIHEKIGVSYLNMGLPNNYQNGSGFTSLISGGVGFMFGNSIQLAVDYSYYGLIQPISYISNVNNQTTNFQPQTYQLNLNYYF